MYIKTDVWRFTLFTALGFGSNACTKDGEAPTPVRSSEGAASEPKPKESAREAPPTSWVSECGESQLKRREYARYDLSTCSGNGLEHRATNSVTCTLGLPRKENVAAVAKRSVKECKSDAECTDKPYGHCSNSSSPPGMRYYVCQYGCVTDADCGEGQLCNCYLPVGKCVAANCTQDSDCGPGLLCAEAFTNDGSCGQMSYRCQKREDECAVSADCPEEQGAACLFDGTRRVCDKPGPTCGRPFLVEGEALLAPLSCVPFGDQGDAISVACLDAVTRETLGRYWAQIGLMEHASIAAFARFAMQLMHVGAPLSLLEAAQQAMFDETEHAKACFGIASALSGRSVGPGKLPLDNALTETSIEDIVRLTVREGCVGETVAAIEAAEARATTQEPHIRAVLDRIQADELRHAELAWRFVQWALAEHAASPNPTAAHRLRDVVREEVAAAMAALEANTDAAVSEADRLGAVYGVLPAATRSAVRRSALEGVVAPCAAELLRLAEFTLAKRSVEGFSRSSSNPVAEGAPPDMLGCANG